MLELSKAQLTGHQIQLTDFSSDDLVAGALARRGEKATELTASLHCSAAESLSGDLELLEIALANMLENALYHGAAPFELQMGHKGSAFYIRLTNAVNDQAPSNRDKGHGLGINICRAVAGLHQGSFELQSSRQLQQITAVLEWPR